MSVIPPGAAPPPGRGTWAFLGSWRAAGPRGRDDEVAPRGDVRTRVRRRSRREPEVRQLAPRSSARSADERAIAADPTSSTAYLGLSLARQAEFDLDAALAAARKAVELDPNNVRALIQESSLLFGMGRLREAVKVAKQARQRAPDDAMVNTVWGFLLLARNRVEEAHAAFQTAIEQDSTLGLPHIGLGLVLFRRNQTDEAIEAMRKATLLEPKVSLYNSYLGKAFYEDKRNQPAQHYLEAAKQLDPHDPTPWYYDAIRLQSVNRPVEAVENLQKSIELNDDRGVYRSRLLLDEDLAARSATLGHIYNEVGFTQLGLQEGWRSVNLDPTNYSAHRLLADSYAALPGLEQARVSQLLQAQLLQPINITPVQPRMAETKLLLPSALTAFSLYEFTPLFVQNQPTLWVSVLGGTQSTWGDELILSGLTDRFSYSLGQFHYQSNGYRENNDLENDLYNIFAQAVVTPELNLQIEYRHRETTNGDLQSSFNDIFSRSRRGAIDQDTARVGARYALSPQTNLIASFIYTDRNNEVSVPAFSIGSEQKAYQTEAQLLHKADHFNIITGLGTYSADYNYYGLEQPPTTGAQDIGYGYATFKLPENVLWTLGVSYQANDAGNANLHELNPKFGVQWTLNEQISLRAAAFQVVNSILAAPQTIEPTQVAGFNQFFDDITSTVSKNYGAALDMKFTPRLWGGLGALRRDLDVPIGTLDVPQFYEVEQWQIDQYGAYLYWMPSARWAVKAAGLYERFEVDEGLLGLMFYYPPLPARLRTITFPLDIQYFDPSGFFASMGIVYVNQRVQFLDPPSLTLTPTQNENFSLVNAGLGYRLPKRWGLVALQANNLLDKKFHYQDNSFRISDQSVNPLYIPERTLWGRLVINF